MTKKKKVDFSGPGNLTSTHAGRWLLGLTPQTQAYPSDTLKNFENIFGRKKKKSIFVVLVTKLPPMPKGSAYPPDTLKNLEKILDEKKKKSIFVVLVT